VVSSDVVSSDVVSSDVVSSDVVSSDSVSSVATPPKLSLQNARRLRAIVVGLGLVALGHGGAFIAERILHDDLRWAASLDPVGNFRPPYGLGMPAYVLATMGVAIVAITSISWIAKRFESRMPIRVLARGGRMTFSVYVLHGVIPWALTVHHIVGRDFGFYRSLGIAFGSWLCAIILMGLLQRWKQYGPMEYLLRKIGG
jgi:uncharacterized membrane protein YeiB